MALGWYDFHHTSAVQRASMPHRAKFKAQLKGGVAGIGQCWLRYPVLLCSVCTYVLVWYGMTCSAVAPFDTV